MIMCSSFLCYFCVSWLVFTLDLSKNEWQALNLSIWWVVERWAFSPFHCHWSQGNKNLFKFANFESKTKFFFSFISGITLLGLPTEVYLHGIQYVYVSLGVLLMGLVMSIFYLPVFYGLQITSSYEVSTQRLPMFTITETISVQFFKSFLIPFNYLSIRWLQLYH